MNYSEKLSTNGTQGNFPFIGNREYVHGTDIYSAALQIVRDAWGRYPDEVVGRFHKPLGTQGIFRVRPEGKSSFLQDAYAHFAFEGGAHRCDLGLFATGQPVNLRLPYDEKDVLCHSQTTDNAVRMAAREDYPYIKQIVAMTKELHKHIYPEVKQKWLFTEIRLERCIDPESYAGAIIEVRRGLRFRALLTESAVFVNNLVAGHIFFSATK